MGVDIFSDGNAGMAQTFRYDFRINALLQKYRGMGVPSMTVAKVLGGSALALLIFVEDTVSPVNISGTAWKVNEIFTFLISAISSRASPSA